MAECILFKLLRQNAVCLDSYERMQSFQTVMAECSLFRQLPLFEGTWSAGQEIQQTAPTTVLEQLRATQLVKKFPTFRGT
jgi:hypothetical protein